MVMESTHHTTGATAVNSLELGACEGWSKRGAIAASSRHARGFSKEISRGMRTRRQVAIAAADKSDKRRGRKSRF
jgi:hypothetical protein